MGRWNPWHTVGREYPHIVVSTEHQLPDGVVGLWEGRIIWLCKTLSQAERRSVLTHELMHVGRGLVPLRYRAREELVVDKLAARRLIELPELIDALRETNDVHQLAERLWTDVHTVKVRLDDLDPIEVAEVEHALEDLWIP